jgi:outer membrane receptor protein involved in Fe transport
MIGGQERRRIFENCAVEMLLVFAFSLIVFVPAARAQLSTAAVTGIVTDPSGAAIPQAAIVLRNADTNVEMRSSTNDTGNYMFTNVPPGRYTLRASKEGFSAKELSAFSLLVNQTATFDLALAVGQVTQTVNVEAGGAQVQASTSELGTVIERQEVLNLPLNGRNFTELFLLTPGASPVDASQNGGGGLQNPIGQNVVPAMNGQLNRSNLYYLDGILDIEQQFNTYAISPILDTLQEFKVDAHNDQAQFGQAMGGVVNMVTKSGTNKLHGSLWEFLRNNALDARNPFLPSVTPFKQNQFGVTIGGPIVLPHYDGRNKTFFYAGYEGYRNHTANELLYRTATPAELNGDLSDLGIPIYDPFSTRSDGAGGFIRDQFPNNNISGHIDPGMLAFAKATFPAPVNTGIAGVNAINTDPYTVREDDLQVRVDERLSDKDYAFFRWSQRWQTRITPQQLVNLTNLGTHRIHNYVGSETHTFGPGTVLQMMFGSTSDVPVSNTTFSPVPGGLPDSAGFVAQFAPTVESLGRRIVPNVSIPGFLGGGESAPKFGVYQNVFQGKADLTNVHGRHIFKMGFDLTKVGYLNGGTAMNVNFAALQTSDPASPGGTGSPLASFLLGVPNGGSLNNFSYRKHKHWVEGYYFQDQWKATNKLTVNFGLRYDLTKMPVAGDFSDGTVYSGDINFDNGTYILQAQPPFCSAVSSGPCIPGSALPDHVVVSPTSPVIQKNTNTNFSPRLGLAYRLGSGTALRASVGVFTDNWSGVQQYGGNYFGDWPSIGVLAPSQNLNTPTASSPTPTITAQDPLGFGTSTRYLPPPTPFAQQEWYSDPNLRNPYSTQWNFGVQHQLRSNTIVTANYVGSSTSHLPLSPYTNTAVTPGPGNPTLRQPYPYIAPTFYSKSIGRGNYNAFQFQLERRHSNGLMYTLSYTWSKSEDIGCSGFFGVEGCSIQNPYNLDADKSVSAYDLPHTFNASWVYELPFGRGHKYKTDNRAVDYALGGWQINGILTLTSGLPYDVGVSGDPANTGGSGCCTYGYERLNVVGDYHVSNITPAAGFNASAFALPDLYTYGNEGRNALRTGGFSNIDFSLFREFPLPRSETAKIQFRFESFNTFNHPTWGTPTVDFNNTNFGRIFGTRSTPRQLQLALKFLF